MGFSALLARWQTLPGPDRATLSLLLLVTVVALAVSIVAGIWSWLEGRKDRRVRDPEHF